MPDVVEQSSDETLADEPISVEPSLEQPSEAPQTRDAPTRAAVIGALIKRARIGAGKTRKDCAAFLGTTSSAIARFEDGQAEPSLADVEALAYFLRAPIGSLLQSLPDAGPAEASDSTGAEARSLIRLRRYIIGARLKQARQAKGEDLRAAAGAVGIAPAQLKAYELGKRAAPISALEALMAHYAAPLESLFDVGVGLFGERQLVERQQAAFAALPPDLRAFISDADARHYLRIARSLQNLSADEMRAIGEAFSRLVSLKADAESSAAES